MREIFTNSQESSETRRSINDHFSDFSFLILSTVNHMIRG